MLYSDAGSPEISGQSGEFMEDLSAVVNSTVFLVCDARGMPPPAVSWLRDGLPLLSSTRHRIQEDGRLLEVSELPGATEEHGVTL